MSGGGSKQPKETTQVVKNQNIPEWMQPYVTDVAQRSQAVSREGYQPYGGQRVAGFTDPQVAAFTETAGLQRPGQFDDAAGIYGGINTAQAGEFDAAAAQKYMSPYQQNVTDIAIRKAQDESARQQGLAQLGAAGRGSAGGSRQAIMDAMRQRGLTESVGDIQARGSQQAFGMAQQQFERDRQARELDRRAQFAQAQGLTGLGGATQQADLRRLAAQGQAGATQQQLQQKILGQRYADFLRQRDYPKEQLALYSNIVRGLPAGTETSEIAYAQPPSAAQQWGGAGIAGLGLMRELQG